MAEMAKALLEGTLTASMLPAGYELANLKPVVGCRSCPAAETVNKKVKISS